MLHWDADKSDPFRWHRASGIDFFRYLAWAGGTLRECWGPEKLGPLACCGLCLLPDAFASRFILLVFERLFRGVMCVESFGVSGSS